jgi:hypothetical protein
VEDGQPPCEHTAVPLLLVGLAATAFGFRAAFLIAAIPLAVGSVLALRTPETLPRAGGPELQSAPGVQNDAD